MKQMEVKDERVLLARSLVAEAMVLQNIKKQTKAHIESLIHLIISMFQNSLYQDNFALPKAVHTVLLDMPK